MKIVVVLPAYNAEKTLEKTISNIPIKEIDEILLCDDGSSDNTYFKACELGINSTRHDKNLGYGANQKTLYKWALSRSADIVVMLHPDYQYEPKLIPYLIPFIKEDICDCMLATRIRTREETLKGGMPLYKYLGNRLLTIIENTFTGSNLSEWHTGLRAFKREILEKIPWQKNSNDFVFDAQLLLQCRFMNFRIGEIPAPAKYFKEASSINFMRSVKYGLQSLWWLFRFILAKIGISQEWLKPQELK